MGLFARASIGVMGAAALALVGALPAACSSESGETSGKRLALAVRVHGSPEVTAPFTNAAGWTITLSKALLSVGPLYYYDGATIFSRAEPARSPLRRLEDLFAFERVAWAHPGHYVPGDAKGQYLAPASVDLMKDTVLGTGEGISGVVRSATFTFQSPAEGAFASELGANVALLEGTATKGSEQRAFHVEVRAEDVTNAEGAVAVEGCPFAETDMEADGTVTLTVNVKPWFDQVELDGVPASADGAPAKFPDGDIGRRELVRGMKEGLGYAFAYAPGLPE